MLYILKALVFTLPLQEFYIPIGNTNHVEIYDFLSIILVIVFLYKEKIIAYKKDMFVLFILSLWIMSGVFFAFNIFAVIAKVLKVTLNIFVYIAVYNICKKYHCWQELIDTLYISVFVESVFSISEYVFINYIGEGMVFHSAQIVDNIARVDGTFNDANYLALYMSCCLICITTDMFYNKFTIRKIMLLLLILVVLMMSFSRSGLLAAIFGLFTTLHVYALYKGKKMLICKIIVIGVIPIIGCLIYFPDLLIRYITMFDLERGDVYVRIVQYLTAIEMIIDNPIMGVGAGNYMNNIMHYNSFTGGTLIPHNSFLEIAAESGIVAVLFMILFFKMILCNIYRYRNKWIYVSMVGMVIGTIISGLFYSNIYYQMMMYLCIGMGQSYGEKCEEN